MRGKIENLGDYNTMRIMLQNNGGDLAKLVKEIQYNAFPRHCGIGILVSAPIWITGTVGIMKILNNMQKKRELKEKEYQKKLERILEEEQSDKE